MIGAFLMWIILGVFALGITGTRPPKNMFLIVLALIVWPIYVGCSMANCCDCAM